MLLVLSPARESRWFTTKSDVLAFTQKTVPFPWPSTAECTAVRSWRSLRHRWCTGRFPFSPRILLFFRGKVKVWEGVARSVLNRQVASKSLRIVWEGIPMECTEFTKLRGVLLILRILGNYFSIPATKRNFVSLFSSDNPFLPRASKSFKGFSGVYVVWIERFEKFERYMYT